MIDKGVYFLCGILCTVMFYSVSFNSVNAETEYAKQQMKTDDEEKFFQNHMQLKMINVNLGNIRKEITAIKEIVKGNKND